jgi:hypothetical protein
LRNPEFQVSWATAIPVGNVTVQLKLSSVSNVDRFDILAVIAVGCDASQSNAR